VEPGLEDVNHPPLLIEEQHLSPLVKGGAGVRDPEDQSVANSEAAGVAIDGEISVLIVELHELARDVVSERSLIPVDRGEQHRQAAVERRISPTEADDHEPGLRAGQNLGPNLNRRLQAISLGNVDPEQVMSRVRRSRRHVREH
jgi:hypothetical protein